MFLRFTLICIGCSYFWYANIFFIFNSQPCELLKVLKIPIALIALIKMLLLFSARIFFCGIVFVVFILIAKINDFHDRF